MTAYEACGSCLKDEKTSGLTVLQDVVVVYFPSNVSAIYRLGVLGAVISTGFRDDVDVGTLNGV